MSTAPRVRVRAHVHVMPREDILDPQGDAVGRALRRLGFEEVAGVRVGKRIAVDLGELPAAQAADRPALEARVADMARRLLANPVVEDFQVELDVVPCG